MDKLVTCLWFDGKAEEAAKFYTSIFADSKIDSITYYGDAGPGQKGSVMTVIFHLAGQEFLGLNGGPEYQFTPAISLMVNCKDQSEIDYYWQHLSEGGETNVCGWLTDKYGLSWQVVPTVFAKLIGDKDEKKSQSVMRAMLQMTKLNIALLQAAYDQA